MDDSILIETVRNCREIYDKGHAGFKNPAIKESAWRFIANTVNASVPDCIARWNTSRERYGKEKRLREAETKSGAEASKRPMWPHFNAMSFLNTHMRQRKSVHNFPPAQNSSSYVQPPFTSQTPSASSTDDETYTLLCLDSGNVDKFDENSVESKASDISQDAQFEVISTCHVVPSTYSGTGVGSTKSTAASLPFLGPSGRCKKHKVDDTAEMFKETLANLNKSMGAPTPPTPNSDPDSLIGQSVTACLKNLVDDRMKLSFRKKFRYLVQECEEAMLSDI